MLCYLAEYKPGNDRNNQKSYLPKGKSHKNGDKGTAGFVPHDNQAVFVNRGNSAVAGSPRNRFVSCVYGQYCGDKRRALAGKQFQRARVELDPADLRPDGLNSPPPM